jgi:23S rRNA pseudouridine1911/1915/1917 synthase
LKPAGLLSQADGTGAPDILSALQDYLKVKYGKKGEAYLGLVHRLDRPVGGVMAFAKTSKAAGRLSAQFRERNINKVYCAVLLGTPGTAAGRLEHRIVKDNAANRVRVGEFVDEHGGECRGAHPDAAGGVEYAALEYCVEAVATDCGDSNITSGGGLTLIRVRLLTGRPHQIRAQFAHIGCPVAGDRKYGGMASCARDMSGPALWAASLTFAHPVMRTPVTVSAPPPEKYPWNLFNDEILSRIISG